MLNCNIKTEYDVYSTQAQVLATCARFSLSNETKGGRTPVVIEAVRSVDYQNDA